MTTRLAPGDHAPGFTLPDSDGRAVSLADLKGRRIIVFVYPAAMTPGCTTQACDFRDSEASLKAHGFEILGLSPDPPAALARFRDRYHLPYPLLSDPSRDVLSAYGAYGEKSQYGKTVTGVIRSTFVISPDGAIEVAAYNVRAKGHVAKLRRDLGIDDPVTAADPD